MADKGFRTLTREDLKGFDAYAKNLVMRAMNAGGLGRVSRNGHAILRTPHGESTIAIGRRLALSNRSRQNAEADYARLFGPLELERQEKEAVVVKQAATRTRAAERVAGETMVQCPACGIWLANEATRDQHIKDTHAVCRVKDCLVTTDDYIGPFVAKDLRGMRAHERVVHEPEALQEMLDARKKNWEARLRAGKLRGNAQTARWHAFILTRKNREPGTYTTFHCIVCGKAFNSQSFDLNKTDFCPDHRPNEPARYLPEFIGKEGMSQVMKTAVAKRSHKKKEPEKVPYRVKGGTTEIEVPTVSRSLIGAKGEVALPEASDAYLYTLALAVLTEMRDRAGATDAVKTAALEAELAEAQKTIDELKAKLALVFEAAHM